MQGDVFRFGIDAGYPPATVVKAADGTWHLERFQPGKLERNPISREEAESYIEVWYEDRAEEMPADVLAILKS